MWDFFKPRKAWFKEHLDNLLEETIVKLLGFESKVTWEKNTYYID